MKILAVDVGTGTQDILLFDSQREVENCYKFVLPAPTVMLARAIRQATQAGADVVLTGTLMGGGPCAWAARDHVQAGYDLFVTPAAARTFDDDLTRVAEMGFTLVSEDEAAGIKPPRVVLNMHDFDYWAISNAAKQFGLNMESDLDGLAIAVFDHGDAPPEVSDRLFRFDYLAERIQAQDSLTAFAFAAEAVPAEMTRLQAVAESVTRYRDDIPVLVMDTAPAAILGALQDPVITHRRPAIVVNIGNFHCLAFRLSQAGIDGLFEHHTGELTPAQLEGFIHDLASGNLTHEQIFNSNGHGAILFRSYPIPLDTVAVVGPRRNFLRGSAMNMYQATPFGDMMLAGAYGLVAAYGDIYPAAASAIQHAFAGQGGKSLW